MNYSIKERIEEVKGKLTSEDILVFEFDAQSGKKFACIYADGIVDKNMIGELVIKPLRATPMEATAEEVRRLLASPDVKDGKNTADAIKNVSDGNAVLYIDGEKDFYIIGVKNPPGRSVAEPPTQISVKGPREGFTEDIKINLGLVRKRLKSDKLKVKTLSVGKQSQTAVAICYIDGV